MALSVFAFPINTVKANGLQETYNPQQTAFDAEQQWSSQLVAHAQTLVGKRTGQCVTSLRTYFGIPRTEVQGFAKNTKINSSQPKVGSVIVFKKMSWAGHVGLVIKTEGELVTYFDSNGDWRQRGAIRTININDRKISGYRII